MGFRRSQVQILSPRQRKASCRNDLQLAFLIGPPTLNLQISHILVSFWIGLVSGIVSDYSSRLLPEAEPLGLPDGISAKYCVVVSRGLATDAYPHQPHRQEPQRKRLQNGLRPTGSLPTLPARPPRRTQRARRAPQAPGDPRKVIQRPRHASGARNAVANALAGDLVGKAPVVDRLLAFRPDLLTPRPRRGSLAR
jgi:hypothetical protein